MPRYFFNILDRPAFRDKVGTECRDVDMAQAEAVRASGEMVQNVADSLRDGSDWRMEVTDDNGCAVFAVRISVEDVNGSARGRPADIRPADEIAAAASWGETSASRRRPRTAAGGLSADGVPPIRGDRPGHPMPGARQSAPSPVILSP